MHQKIVKSTLTVSKRMPVNWQTDFLHILGYGAVGIRQSMHQRNNELFAIS